MFVDFNHRSGSVYGGGYPVPNTNQRINALVDQALVAENQRQIPRDYLGASRIGEPCSRKLVYEFTHTQLDPGKEFTGSTLRIFAAGHQFEDLSILWLRAAGFDLRTHDARGGQFGFKTANGRIKGHIDGVIVSGPDVGMTWPALWEHKALKASSWNDTVKHGVQASKPVYFGQLQIYMAYMDLPMALFTILNKDTQALHHEVVPFDAVEAQILSDKAVDVIQAADARALPPRISSHSDFYLCRWCAYARRCWEPSS
jgi:hypothetical protein